MPEAFFRKPRLFCPGPTPVAQSALTGLLRTNVYHRTSEFYESLKACRRMLAPFFGSRHEPLILTASGTGAMEAAITNLTAVGDSVVAVAAGKFGERWQLATRRFGCAVEAVDAPWGEAPTEAAIVAGLKAAGSPKAIFLHACETSTAMAPPLERLCAAVRRAAPNCLIVVDAISALVAHSIKMDDWGIDCMVAGSQKGFGVPPGLAFINLSERAWERLSDRPRFYFDLAKERKEQATGATAWTPATGLVLALEGVLVELGHVGVAGCVAHHQRLARACRQAPAAIGLGLLSKDHPSDAATAITLPPSIDGEAMLKAVRKRYGAIFAGGQDRLKGRIVRLAHLGYSDELDVIAALAALEFGLKASGHSFTLGAGVAAAMATLAETGSDC